MCSGAKSVARKVIGVLKKTWNFIRKYLAVIVFVVAVFFPYLVPFLQAYLSPALYGFLTSGQLGSVMLGESLKSMAIRAVIGLGAAYIISTEGGDAIVRKAADVAGKITEGAGTIIGGVAGGIAASIPGWLWIAAGGALAFVVLGRRKTDGVQDISIQLEYDDKEGVYV